MTEIEEFEKTTIIIAAYANESAAVGALAGLEHWADTRKDIELGAIGALQKEGDDVIAKIMREADKGRLVSGAMGLAKSLLGPIAVVGDAVGGLARSFFKREDPGLAEAFNQLGNLLEAGNVSLVMVATPEEASAIGEQLELMCGSIIMHDVPQEVLEEVAAAVEAAKEAAEQQEKAEKEAEKAAKEAKKQQEKAEKEAEKAAKKEAKKDEEEAEEES